MMLLASPAIREKLIIKNYIQEKIPGSIVGRVNYRIDRKCYMLKFLKFVMKVFYANENYAKYGVRGMNYFMALVMASIYILVTAMAIGGVLFAVFPTLYTQFRLISPKLSTIPLAILTYSIVILFLRMTVKEKSLLDESFAREYVKRCVNYLIGYCLLVVLIIGIVTMGILRYRQ